MFAWIGFLWMAGSVGTPKNHMKKLDTKDEYASVYYMPDDMLNPHTVSVAYIYTACC